MQARCFNAVDVSKKTLDAVAACDLTLFVEQVFYVIQNGGVYN